MSNIIDSIQLSGVTYQIQGSGGGGKAIEAGRGISITTGETADTVSFDLPISAGTGSNSIIEGYNTKANGFSSHAEGQSTTASGSSSHAEGNNTTANGDQSHAEGYYAKASGNYSHAEGYYTTASGNSSHAEGFYTTANGNQSHAEGFNTTASGKYSHAEGDWTIANNQSEHASGQYNVSSSASTTFGDSGNTLFSVGNGTAANARHNAFEIRQNGDIYLSSGGTDIKLQDHLGGGGSVTVDTELDSGSTNPVQNKVIYNKIDEVEQVTAAGLNALNDKITPTVELTQAEYNALVTAGTVAQDTYYIITDAQAGDLTNYYTKSETNTLLGGKQDTLVSSSNIKTINNESILGSGNINIQGGSTYTAGRGIDITNDTISFNLPISADSNTYINAGVGNTNNNTALNILIGSGNTAYNGNAATVTGGTAIGFGNQVGYIGRANFSKSYSFAFGYGNKINGGQSYAIGYNNNIGSGTNYSKDKSFLIGYYNTCTFNGDSSGNYMFGNYCTVTKSDEFALGKYNASNNGSTDADKTFFSIGNGTSTSARHNAFEIRQNGDIYLSLNGQDVKLQDQLGGSSITVDTALDSGSTNPVENRVIYNKIDEVEQVTAAGLNAVNSALGGLKLQQITQSDFNNLQTKDPSTLYIIVN